MENIPFRAIEEAVVNAVYHRGYDVREPIEVRIMHNELVVLSYPGSDRSVRMEQLRIGKAMPRRYRNRRIGEFLKELKFTEGRATGIPKILKAMANNGSPAPEFESDDERSYFMVRLPVHPAALAVEAAATLQVTEQGGTSRDHVTPHVTPHVQELLSAICSAQSRTEIMATLGLKDRMHFAKEYLQPALKADLIEMTIPDKPKSVKQKYRLTAAGKVLVEQQKPGDGETDV